MRSVSEYIDDLSSLTCGFIRPIYEQRDPKTGALILAGLSYEDWERVRSGYACGACLIKFRTYLARCPACGHERDLAADISELVPRDWKEHLELSQQVEKGEVVPEWRLPSMDRLLDEIAKDKDVEQIPLKKLKPRRRG